MTEDREGFELVIDQLFDRLLDGIFMNTGVDFEDPVQVDKVYRYLDSNFDISDAFYNDVQNYS